MEWERGEGEVAPSQTMLACGKAEALPWSGRGVTSTSSLGHRPGPGSGCAIPALGPARSCRDECRLCNRHGITHFCNCRNGGSSRGECVVRERERNKRWRDVIQSDARWPASLPKTVGAARRGVFHPLNYSGTLLKAPTPTYLPPSIPQTSSSQDAFPRGTRPAIVSGNRTTIAYLAALLYQRRCPIPTADRTDLQGPTRTQPLCHPPYAPESGGGALCYSQTSHARCGYEYRQMRQSGLDRYQRLASDLHGGEEGPTSYTVAGMVYRLECGADCSR